MLDSGLRRDKEDGVGTMGDVGREAEGWDDNGRGAGEDGREETGERVRGPGM